jgi:hypothetical protein
MAMGTRRRSACEPLPNPLPEALVPQDRDVAAMHLGANTLGHDEGADRISAAVPVPTIPGAAAIVGL